MNLNKMKQLQLNQFPLPLVKNTHKKINNKHNNCNTHTQLIRIIAALLIALYIYSKSQQTSINYNEIIQNQKMFLVKNIRGMIPTLNGKKVDIQKSWQVKHFQNYSQNQSQIFNQFILQFIDDNLYVKQQHCKQKLLFSWKSYSYNIDIQKQILTFVKQTDQQISQIQITQNNQQVSQIILNDYQDNKQLKYSTTSESTMIDQKSCLLNYQKFESLIQNCSIWTISDNFLYLLIQNVDQQEDFYLILQQQ